MATRASLYALIFLLATPIEMENPEHLIIWNVGQGLWTTVKAQQQCWHFDVGGEKAPWREIRQQCREFENRIFLSHWDWDHIGFLSRIRFALPNVCVIRIPLGESTSQKRALVSRHRICSGQIPFVEWNDVHSTTSNGLSHIAWWKNILFPGDSTRREEKLWLTKIQNIKQTRFLILGHHGSKTSTGRELLKQLPNLKTAIASARYRKYGHPHRDVLKNLKQFHIPILKTEDWGNIYIWL